MHFCCQVNQYDALPKCSCVDCWHRIEDFHNFHRSVHNAQADYLKRTVKSEITDREPDHAPHETIKPPNFVEVITNCEEFNEFAEETLKANADEFDDVEHQEEEKLQDFDDMFNDIASAKDDEESNEDACDKDDDNTEYYKEEMDDQEAGTVQSLLKHLCTQQSIFDG